MEGRRNEEKKLVVPPLKTALVTEEKSATPRSPIQKLMSFFSPKKDNKDKRKEKEVKHNEAMERAYFEDAFRRVEKSDKLIAEHKVLSNKEFKRRSQDVSKLLRGEQPAPRTPTSP